MSYSYRRTPVQEITTPIIAESGVRLLIKREDMNHPEISGNKWWKLKYNIEEALQLNCETVLTFGGAYSNHIFATSAAAREVGLKSIGIIRGEVTLPLNKTLSFAKDKGMEIHYVSRENYRGKAEPEFLNSLRHQFGHFYLIPEGGTNELAVKGVSEFAKEFIAEVDCDYVCLPVGTGGTMAGIIRGITNHKTEVIGFSSLKGGEFLDGEVTKLCQQSTPQKKWSINTDYHFGGYAKKTEQLEEFILQMWHDHAIHLDEIYTGKMMFGIYDLIKNQKFKRGSTILAIHTGGLQSR